MRLTPGEQDRLQVFGAASLAREALHRGLRLSAAEAVAVIADEMHWAARAGRDYGDVLEAGRSALRVDQVLPGVPNLLVEIRVEPLFDDGSRLVVLRHPLGWTSPGPGEVILSDLVSPSESDGLERRELEVVNPSPRVVRISSHYPIARANPHLLLDREAARGFRLDLPAGDLLRLGPGERRQVRLVAIGASMQE